MPLNQCWDLTSLNLKVCILYLAIVENISCLKGEYLFEVIEINNVFVGLER